MKYLPTNNVLNCVDTKNYQGVRTIFTENQRTQKAERHPELRLYSVIKRIKKTIESPDFVYVDMNDECRRSYYCREYKIDSRIMYTKVVLLKLKTHYFVITAYRPDYIKERGKTCLIYGKDNE